MITKITNWAMDAHTVAAILDVPVETFRTWRKRDGLLPQGEWMGSGRRPPMSFEFRHLLQAKVAQKLMSVGVHTKTACKAAHYGVFQNFLNREPVVVGFVDGQFQPDGYSDDDVCLTFSVEKTGVQIARAIADEIAIYEGDTAGKDAFDAFTSGVSSIRAQMGQENL